jgi:hypothetical protein
MKVVESIRGRKHLSKRLSMATSRIKATARRPLTVPRDFASPLKQHMWLLTDGVTYLSFLQCEFERDPLLQFAVKLHEGKVGVVLRNVCRTLYCLSHTLPGASPQALLLGGSCSSSLVPCRCFAPARHVGLSRFISAWPCPVKPFSSKQKKKKVGGSCYFACLLFS